MSILSTISHYAHEFAEARTRYLTERTIRALPFELQKDIGWPEASGSRSVGNAGVGTWAGSK